MCRPSHSYCEQRGGLDFRHNHDILSEYGSSEIEYGSEALFA